MPRYTFVLETGLTGTVQATDETMAHSAIANGLIYHEMNPKVEVIELTKQPETVTVTFHEEDCVFVF